MHELWCDGGVVGKNPSPIGGTWAFVHVVDGQAVRRESGHITPAQCGAPAVTNNVTELLAALRAIQSVPKDWRGTLWTDSEVTYYRLHGNDPKGVPGWLLDLLREEWGSYGEKMGLVQVRLCAGHPTKLDLIRGWQQTARGRTPVSEWNVWCDEACGRQAKALKETTGSTS